MIADIVSGRRKMRPGIIPEIGCSMEDLIWHIKRQMTEEMTFKNYGSWNIDHIIPYCFFDLENDHDFMKVNHWSNLRPILAEENTYKSYRDKKRELEKVLPDYEKLRHLSPLRTVINENRIPVLP